LKEVAYSQHLRLPETELVVLEEYVKAIDDGKKRKKRTSRSLAMPITQSSRMKNDFLLEDWCGLLHQKHENAEDAIPIQ
jgi:hypothetical protein